MNEEYSFESSFLRILDDEFDYNDTIELFKTSDVGATELEFEPLDPYDFVLDFGNENISLTPNEKIYIKYVYRCCSLVNYEGLRIFVVNLNLNSDKPYSECAAIIKIFNLLFSDKNNLFFFIAKGKVALGCKRLSDEDIKNNFCISSFYSYECVSEAYNFFNSYCEDLQDYADNIIVNSEIEGIYINYDCLRYNYSYNEVLQSVIDDIVVYDEDDNYKEICYVSLDSNEEELLPTYESISKELKLIGEYRESKSAFELLNDAKYVAMRKFAEQVNEPETKFVAENGDKEDLEDAEIILNRILNNKWGENK